MPIASPPFGKAPATFNGHQPPRANDQYMVQYAIIQRFDQKLQKTEKEARRSASKSTLLMLIYGWIKYQPISIHFDLSK